MCRAIVVFTALMWAAPVVAQPAGQSPAEGSAAAEPKADEAGAAAAPKNAPAANTEVDVSKVEEKPAPAPPASGSEAYKVRITELETRVNELKEKIFRSKTRLAILKGAVLNTGIAGAEARLVHRNEMGAAFRLEKVIYSLNGTPIFSQVDNDGDLDEREEIEIFNGPIVSGNNTLSVVMVYRGNGYGIFSYLKGYVFTLRSSNTFRSEEGKLIEVKAVGFEKGGITTDLADRPAIRFETKLTDSRRARSAAVQND